MVYFLTKRSILPHFRSCTREWRGGVQLVRAIDFRGGGCTLNPGGGGSKNDLFEDPGRAGGIFFGQSNPKIDHLGLV